MKNLIFLFIGIVASPAWAGEGGTGGHGGGAWYCENPSDNKLLDLWEADELHKLEVIRSNNSVEEQVAKAAAGIARWNPKLGKRVEELTTRWMKEYKREIPRKTLDTLSDRTEIDPPPDTKNLYSVKGCRLLGAAIYTDKLRVSPMVYESLPSTDKAALWIHEAVYFILRETLNEQDSVLTRRIVGELFSRIEKVQSDFVYRCAPKNSDDRGEAEIRVRGSSVEVEFISLRFAEMFPFSQHVKVIDNDELASVLKSSFNGWQWFRTTWLEPLKEFIAKAAIQDHELRPENYQREPDNGDVKISFQGLKEQKVKMTVGFYLQKRYVQVKSASVEDELICNPVAQ